jgi:hypothetical protein
MGSATPARRGRARPPAPAARGRTARLKKRKLLLKDEIQVLTDRIIPDIIA